MSLKLELTTKQFIKFFGHKKYIKRFSEESIELILDCIRKDQEEWGFTSTEWKEVFRQSREYDDATIIAENIELIDGLAPEILAMASGLLGLSDEVYAQLDDEKIPNDSKLFIKIRKELEAAKDWEEGLATVIAKSKSYIELEYGNYLFIAEPR